MNTHSRVKNKTTNNALNDNRRQTQPAMPAQAAVCVSVSCPPQGGTYDGTTIKTYINGQLVASTKHKGEISAPGYSFELDGGGNWTGAIDDLYIFDTELNEEQVKKLHEM